MNQRRKHDPLRTDSLLHTCHNSTTTALSPLLLSSHNTVVPPPSSNQTRSYESRISDYSPGVLVTCCSCRGILFFSDRARRTTPVPRRHDTAPARQLQRLRAACSELQPELRIAELRVNAALRDRPATGVAGRSSFPAPQSGGSDNGLVATCRSWRSA